MGRNSKGISRNTQKKTRGVKNRENQKTHDFCDHDHRELIANATGRNPMDPELQVLASLMGDLAGHEICLAGLM